VPVLSIDLGPVEDKRRVGEMFKLRPVWIEFKDQLPRLVRIAVLAQVELQMVAVRAHHCLREADGFVAVRPVECGLQHNLLRRIALRLVESSCRLVLPEDVRHAVIADAVARTEVRVRVVVERAPADPADVATYINFMTALAPGTSGTFSGQTIARSINLFGSLPTATVTGSHSGTGTTIDLNAFGTFTYLFAKYDGQNDVSQVWNISGLTGVITIPADGPLGYGLSGWILFGPTGQVPDGGTTAMLLGTALGALGMARRFLKR